MDKSDPQSKVQWYATYYPGDPSGVPWEEPGKHRLTHVKVNDQWYRMTPIDCEPDRDTNE